MVTAITKFLRMNCCGALVAVLLVSLTLLPSYSYSGQSVKKQPSDQDIALYTKEQAEIEQTYCFNEAATQYNLPPLLLWALSRQESNGRQVISRNNNGTEDYCHMQINSSWEKRWGSKLWKQVKASILADPCYCTKIGAYILNQCVQQYGYTGRAIGCYHSQNPRLQERYASQVIKHWQKATIWQTNYLKKISEIQKQQRS